MVRGAPASSVAKTPGLPSVSTRVTLENPASRASRIIVSHPSSVPRFSAAMAGCLTHSCRRFTPSSWRLAISALIAARFDGVAAGAALGAAASVAAAAPRTSAADRDTANNGKGRRMVFGMRRSLMQLPASGGSGGRHREAIRREGRIDLDLVHDDAHRLRPPRGGDLDDTREGDAGGLPVVAEGRRDLHGAPLHGAGR